MRPLPLSFEEGGPISGATAVRAETAPRLDQKRVLDAYSRWAPIYDLVFHKTVLFGRSFDVGRRAALAHFNTRSGRLLEVGVGTGITLPGYKRHLSVTGIDLSADMLEVARKRVADEKLDHVEALLEMDAAELAFPDLAFDLVAVMYTITVVPHPERVMAEIRRVTRPGGEVMILSHFAPDSGWRAWVEGALTPLTKRLGWRPDYPVERVTSEPGFRLIEERRIGRLGFFTLLRLERI